MNAPGNNGPRKNQLEKLIGRHSRDEGVAADRVRRWISTMALLGALERVQVSGPKEIACLPLRFQIAQKLHAVTERPDDRANDRFRDLVDLLVLRELVDDLAALRRACEDTFAYREAHPWPPGFDLPDHWRDGYARLAAELGLDVVDADAAAIEIRKFIATIAAAP